MNKPKFKIDWEDYNAPYVVFRKINYFIFLGDWERMSAFKSMDEARDFIKIIKDLPEYH